MRRQLLLLLAVLALVKLGLVWAWWPITSLHANRRNVGRTQESGILQPKEGDEFVGNTQRLQVRTSGLGDEKG